MARPTAESARITGFSEPIQQLQTQASDRIFRRGAAQALQNSHNPVIAGKALFPFSLRPAFFAAPLLPSIFALAVSPPSSKRTASQAVAPVDRICASAWRGLGLTSALLGVAVFAALGGTALKAQTASFTATQRTLGSGFDSPSDVAVDSSGNLFVADSRNNAVKEILAAGGYTTVNTLAAADGHFNQPSGAAVDVHGTSSSLIEGTLP
jgi:DNA-binding beta-propeller fold protein YncE